MVKSQKQSKCVCGKWEAEARIYMHHQWQSGGEEFECYTKTMQQQQRGWSQPRAHPFNSNSAY